LIYLLSITKFFRVVGRDLPCFFHHFVRLTVKGDFIFAEVLSVVLASPWYTWSNELPLTFSLPVWQNRSTEFSDVLEVRSTVSVRAHGRQTCAACYCLLFRIFPEEGYHIVLVSYGYLVFTCDFKLVKYYISKNTGTAANKTE